MFRSLPRKTFSSSQREELYRLECDKARSGNRGEFPICNLCDLPVLPGHKWDRSHSKHKPKALGGTEIGVAHLRCNRVHGARVVAPMMAKLRRIQSKLRDIPRPAQPLPGGRDDRLKHKLDGQVVLRTTGKRP